MTTTIAIRLATDIMYVAGIVNGINKVFVQDEAHPENWTASVEVSESGEYDIYIQAHDFAGNISEYHTTQTFFLPTFVYDRTEQDIKRALELSAKAWEELTEAEKKEWRQGLKGCLNRKDLERTERNISVIADMLDMDLHTFKDNVPAVPSETYFQQLLENVQILRHTGRIRSDTPEVPQMPLTHYEKWNAIEKILHDVYWNITDSFSYYAGTELFSGESVGWIL